MVGSVTDEVEGFPCIVTMTLAEIGILEYGAMQIAWVGQIFFRPLSELMVEASHTIYGYTSCIRCGDTPLSLLHDADHPNTLSSLLW